jgi:hypothetical protein
MSVEGKMGVQADTRGAFIIIIVIIIKRREILFLAIENPQ